MKVVVERDKLKDAISFNKSVSKNISTLPILENVMISTVEMDKIICSSTDLAVSVTCTVESENDEQGTILINAKKLSEILNKVSVGNVFIETKDSKVIIRSGSASFNMVSADNCDFPKLPDEPDYSENDAIVNSFDLLKMIDVVLATVAKEQHLSHLQGALADPEGGASNFVSTDSGSMSIAKGKCINDIFKSKVFIGTKGLEEIRRLLKLDKEENVRVVFDEKNLFFVKGNILLSVKTDYPRFPNYLAIFKQIGKSKIAIIDKDLLSNAIDRVAVFAIDETHSVFLSFSNDCLLLKSNDFCAIGTAEEAIRADYNGGDFTVCLNSKRVLNIIKNLDDTKIKIICGDDAFSPVMFENASNSNIHGIIMPLRVD